eukprot:jgi/Botrbrau1/15673/Bobra.4_1s0054.1
MTISLLRRAAPSLRAFFVGQPCHRTHPELVGPGEVMPGIPAAEFQARRKALVDAMPAGGAAVVASAQLAYMTGMIPYPYRQDADFLYLTGICQPGVALISASSYTLFVPNTDPQVERWDGAHLSCQAAIDMFGADEAYPFSEMPRRLEEAIREASVVWHDVQSRQDGAARQPASLLTFPLLGVRQALEQGSANPLRSTLHSLRWVKSEAELRLLRKSARLSTTAMASCMAASRPDVGEHFLAALFEYECKSRGAQRTAYPPVVAGGTDACTIHYSRNDKRLHPGDLLLMDGGCELHGYASDVTRTWPVSGRFSPAQRDVYEAVLDAHQQCVAACRGGATLRSIHNLSIRLLGEAIQQLGLFPGASLEAICSSGYRSLYPHSIGHWLGLDTHDTSSIGHVRQLQAGVVMTIEPGLYIPPDSRFGRYAGIGIRIEDDIAVTQGDPEVLSGDLPVDAEGVERVVRSGEAGARVSVAT